MATKILGASLDAGQEKDKEQEDEDVDGCDVLEGETRKTIEIWGDAHVEGEVRIEEG